MKISDINLGLDFIGDVHGYGSVLESLIERLGYLKNGGRYEHPEGRRIVFLGDYIDRGPEVEKTLRIVRSMVENGSALAILGNHEYNAVCYHTPDGNGDYLRSHTEDDGKNTKQHQSTLNQFSDKPGEWNTWIEWFKTLPFYIEGNGWRAVHAAWDFDSVRKLSGKSLTDEGFLKSSADRASSDFVAVENVLKGLEVELPEGLMFEDHNGNLRSEIRVRWWEGSESGTYRDIIFPPSDSIPEVAVSIEVKDKWTAYSAREAPVFFGHYWIPAKTHAGPLASNVACLDYSVASPKGKLTAYRWNGEAELKEESYVQISV